MKIKNQRIFAALSSLLISAIMLATASFAWFGMNTSNIVDGLQVEAYSDSNYIEIKNNKVGKYDKNATFNESSDILRLATHGFLTEGAALELKNFVQLEAHEIVNQDYDPKLDYYIKTSTGDLIKCEPDTFYDSSSTKDYYKNPEFELVTSDEKVTGDYYTYASNTYTSKKLQDESAKGYYKLVAENKEGDDATYDGASVYYSLTTATVGTETVFTYTDVTHTLVKTNKDEKLNGYWVIKKTTTMDTVDKPDDEESMPAKGEEYYLNFGDDNYYSLGKIGSAEKSVYLIDLTYHKDLVKLKDASASGNYNGKGSYYNKVKSDVSNNSYNYILATDLKNADLVQGYYRDLKFTQVTSSENVTGIYYEIYENGFKRIEVNNESAKGMYAVSHPVKLNATDIEYRAGLPMAEPDDARFDGTGTYYKVDGDKIAKVTLSLGTDLSNYYTLSEAVVLGPTSVGDAEYYLKSKGDYSCLGTLGTKAEPQILKNYLYWGRTYSGVADDAEAGNTLSILSADKGDGTYYHFESFTIRQAEGTNPAKNLRVANVRFGGEANALAPAIRVLIVAHSNTQSEDPSAISVALYDPKEVTDTGKTGGFLQADGKYTETDILYDVILGNEAEEINVDIYVYFDGTDEDAHNEKVANFSGQTVEIEFTIDELDYNE